MPKRIRWPNYEDFFWLIDVYDWDSILLDPNFGVILNSEMRLCAGALPCSVKLYGNPRGRIKRVGAGSIVCLATVGCTEVSMIGIDFDCNQQASASVFKVQGSNLSISDSTFSGCRSESDGAVIQSYAKANVSIKFCNFTDTQSSGYGGAVVAFGSHVRIIQSIFINCSSQNGGGAIWASAFQSAYGSSQSENTSLALYNSDFQQCSSQGSGGAILVSSTVLNNDETVHVLIKRTTFQLCSSIGNGGALRADGLPIIVIINDSNFTKCKSRGSGGAISVRLGNLDLVGATFKHNIAEGLGGGGLHIHSAKLFVVEVFFEGNMALAGGGGIFYLQGSVYPSFTSVCPRGISNLIEFCPDKPNTSTPSFGWHSCHSADSSDSKSSNAICDCDKSNLALYGHCVASNYNRLQILDLVGPTYPGLTFPVVISKVDVYNQTILSDSSSFLQAFVSVQPNFTAAISGYSLAKFEYGVATFYLSVKPILNFKDAWMNPIQNERYTRMTQSRFDLYFNGDDRQTGEKMLSSSFPIFFGNGADVCPIGSILSFEQYLGTGNQSELTCSFCESGTYSINPLAFGADSSGSAPTCISCPAGGDCRQGGETVNFEVGTWNVKNGAYILESCPGGYQLTNSTDGSSHGVFSNILQQCRKCSVGKYIINPNYDECQSCPAGNCTFLSLSVTKLFLTRINLQQM